MSVNEKNIEIEVGKPLSLKNADFLSFQPKREEWNLYKIEDESLIKARLILKSLLIEGSLEDIETQVKLGKKPILRLTFASQQIYAVEAPPNLRGTPESKTYSADDLRLSVTQKDMDYETIRETWNLYEADNGITLRLRISPTIISKTSKFESGGMPVYLIDANLEMKLDLPDHIQKLLEEARKKASFTKNKPA
jgi:hypothetical protein